MNEKSFLKVDAMRRAEERHARLIRAAKFAIENPDQPKYQVSQRYAVNYDKLMIQIKLMSKAYHEKLQ